MANILIIEDDALLGQLYISILHLNNPSHNIFLALTGEEGIEKALSCPPDLIILDIMLPGITGDLVATELQEADILLRTPLIIATAIMDAEAETIAQSLNATAVLSKPLHLNHLLETVHCALASSD